jgi:hypothetical protein
MTARKGKDAGGAPTPAEGRRRPFRLLVNPSEVAPKQRERWVGLIRTAWCKTVAAFIETGRLLNEAKRELPHGSFMEMIDHRLPFTPGTAERLMFIARNPIISDSAHGPNLPPSWHTLYVLAKLPPENLRAKIESGAIHPKLERKEAKRFVAALHKPSLDCLHSDLGAVLAPAVLDTALPPAAVDTPQPPTPSVKLKLVQQQPAPGAARLLAAWDAAGEKERGWFLKRIGARLIGGS